MQNDESYADSKKESTNLNQLIVQHAAGAGVKWKKRQLCMLALSVYAQCYFQQIQLGVNVANGKNKWSVANHGAILLNDY